MNVPKFFLDYGTKSQLKWRYLSICQNLTYVPIWSQGLGPGLPSDQYAHPVPIFSSSFLLFQTCQLRILRSGFATPTFSKIIANFLKKNLRVEHLLGFVTSYLFKGKTKGSPHWGKWNRWLKTSNLTLLDNYNIYTNERQGKVFSSLPKEYCIIITK